MQSVQSKFESLRTVRKLKSKMTYSGPSVEVDVDENAFHPRLVRPWHDAAMIADHAAGIGQQTWRFTRVLGDGL